jgi:hypothetical protein
VSLGPPSSDLVRRVAADLGLCAIRPLEGGLFGAVLMASVNGSGDELRVLKVLPDEALAAEWQTGAAMAETLRRRGYPAPRYHGTRISAGSVWSLQDCCLAESEFVSRRA